MTYSSSVAINRRRVVRRNQNTVSVLAASRTLGPVSNTVVLIVLFCLIGLLYLTQVTKTNSYGFTIHDLQSKQAELQNRKTDLEVAQARLQSLDRVSHSSVAKRLVVANPSGTLR